MFKVIYVSSFLLLTAGAALAQVESPNSGVAREPGRDADSGAPPAEVRFGVIFSLSQPISVEARDKVAAAQAETRKALLALVDNECAVLKQTIASQCELQSLNVSLNLQNAMYARFDELTQDGKTIQSVANAVFKVALRNGSSTK